MYIELLMPFPKCPSPSPFPLFLLPVNLGSVQQMA